MKQRQGIEGVACTTTEQLLTVFHAQSLNCSIVAQILLRFLTNRLCRGPINRGY